MYLNYRCLKPKPGLPSSEWPHYDMQQYRKAKSAVELEKVDEIPFDKVSLKLYCLMISYNTVILFYFQN